MSAAVRIQVLGPVRAWRQGEPLDVGPAGRRGLLGLLALATGRPLSRADLIHSLWGQRPPPSAANMIHTYVKDLRRVLEPTRRSYASSTVLPAVGDGYALQVPTETIDVVRFRHLVGAAARAEQDGAVDKTVALLQESLKLWQGLPLADVPILVGHPIVEAVAAEREAALVRYGRALATAGDWEAARTVLAEAAVAQPMDEAAHAMLIRALQAVGRRAQAFATYHQIRRRLVDELGVDPGPELAAAHAALLHDDSASVVRPDDRPKWTSTPPHPVPAQLPTDVATFAGREEHLRRLDELLADETRTATAVVISTVSGTAGVGKTALAIHWAHQVRDRFPDGQLYVNLRGYSPGQELMHPAEAIRGFLDALQVVPQRIPAGQDAQAALYRSLLSGRRMLVVLDNARDSAQVRPLLPGTAGSLALVTSRRQLTGLVTADGAHPISLELLSPGEARQLLTRRLGAERVASDQQAVEQILTACAGLPLALAIVAARAAAKPALPLAVFAAQLRESRDRLDVLADEDASTDPRTVFSWSYRTLTPAAARVFRLLGLPAGPDISAPAAASLAGLPPEKIRPLLAELTRNNLIVEHTPRRYTFHDLLRAYAVDLAHRIDRDSRRHAAIHRSLDHYLRTAYAASQLLAPPRHDLALSPPRPGVHPESHTTYEQALAWLTTERPVLLAAVDQAANTGLDTHAWQLAWTLADYLERQGHPHDHAHTQHVAVTATRRSGDQLAQALAHRLLARASLRLKRFHDARAQIENAIIQYGRAGDQLGLADSHFTLAHLCEQQGRYTESLDHLRQAIDRYRATEQRRGLAFALNGVGWCHAQLGNHQSALAACQEALSLLEEIGDRSGQAHAWDSLGYTHRRLGNPQAVHCYQQAVTLHHELADRYPEATSLAHLGDAQHDAGDPAAHQSWEAALTILDDLNHTDAAEIRAKLATPETTTQSKSDPAAESY